METHLGLKYVRLSQIFMTEMWYRLNVSMTEFLNYSTWKGQTLH